MSPDRDPGSDRGRRPPTWKRTTSASADFRGPAAAQVAVRRLRSDLCRDGRRALWAGIRQVGADKPLAGIGAAIGAFARRNRYTLVRNLASHGVGHSLHEKPKAIPTWPDRAERRRMNEGLVFTIEPFLSMGGEIAETSDDEWTLTSKPNAPTVQYEHTVVATRRGPMVVTLPG